MQNSSERYSGRHKVSWHRYIADAARGDNMQTNHHTIGDGESLETQPYVTMCERSRAITRTYTCSCDAHAATYPFIEIV